MNPVPQPPFPAELLADLHAGNIDPELGAQLWHAVRQDSDARRYLDSLDEISESLAGLRGSERAGPPIPEGIAAQLDELAESLGRVDAPANAADATGPTEAGEPLGDIPKIGSVPRQASSSSARAGHPWGSKGTAVSGASTNSAGPVSLDSRRRRRTAAALATAALIMIAAAAALFVGGPDRQTAPTAGPATTGNVVPGAELDTAVALRALGRHDVRGRLADPAALAACVQAAGIDRPVLGSADMRFRDRNDAVLVLVGGRNGSQITALVVGPGCRPGNPELMATTDIG